MDFHKFDFFILAGDIGGTNSNLAIVGKQGNRFSIIKEKTYGTKSVTDINEIIQDILSEWNKETVHQAIRFGCISAAGPVENQFCKLTNASWAIDSKKISDYFQFPVTVINDFTALSFGLPLLDVSDESQIIRLRHTNGQYGEAEGNTYAVVGAGTGLGTAALTYAHNHYISLSSEAGHSGFAAFDAKTAKLKDFLDQKYKASIGIEEILSGRGIRNLFNFIVCNSEIIDEVARDIEMLPEEEQIAAIASSYKESLVCQQCMDSFIEIYGRHCSNMALIFLPTTGLFIGGGIISKNLHLFTENKIFMESFDKNYRKSFENFLQKLPVYIIKNYNTSLLGAAHAAVNLFQ